MFFSPLGMRQRVKPCSVMNVVAIYERREVADSILNAMHGFQTEHSLVRNHSPQSPYRARTCTCPRCEEPAPPCAGSTSIHRLLAKRGSRPDSSPHVVSLAKEPFHSLCMILEKRLQPAAMRALRTNCTGGLWMSVIIQAAVGSGNA